MGRKIYCIYSKDRDDGIDEVIIAESEDEALSILNKEAVEDGEEGFKRVEVIIEERGLEKGVVLFHCDDSFYFYKSKLKDNK